MPSWGRRDLPRFPQPPDPAELLAVVEFLDVVLVLTDVEPSYLSTLTH